MSIFHVMLKLLQVFWNRTQNKMFNKIEYFIILQQTLWK